MTSAQKKLEEVRPGQWSRTEWGIFLTVVVVLLVNLGQFGAGADTASRNQGELAMSMVNDRDLVLDEYVVGIVPGHAATGQQDLYDRAQCRGHIYSGFPPGIAFFMVPLYLVLKAALWLLPVATKPALELVVLVMVSAALAAIVSAVSCTLIYKVASLMAGNRLMAIGATLALVPASWYFYYSTYISQKTLSAAMLVFAFYTVIRGTGTFGTAPAHPGRFWLGTGALAGIALAIDYAPVLVAAILGVYITWHNGLRALGLFTLGMLPMVGATGLYHTLAFGGPFTTAYSWRVVIDGIGAAPSLQVPDLLRLYGLTLSPGKGILFYAPWVLLSVVGVFSGLRTQFRRVAGLAATIALVAFVFNLSLDEWSGQGWGPRYFTMALPFLALMLAFLPNRLQRLLWPLLVFAALLNLLPVLRDGPAVPGGTIWDNPITLYGGQILHTGAATYWLRFFSRNVHQLSPLVLTLLQLVLTALTGVTIWFIWR